MRHLFNRISFSGALSSSTLSIVYGNRNCSGFVPRPPADDPAVLLQGRISHHHLLQIHGRVYRFLAHDDNLVATRLMGHYSSNSALKVFHSLRNPNIFPFNAIIRVLAEAAFSVDAFFIFKALKFGGVSPNELTFSFLLKACSREGARSERVEQLHSHVLKSGYLCDAFVCYGLMMAYDKAVKSILAARHLFDEMPNRSLVCCWTSLISGYAKRGLGEKGLDLFCRMMKENLRPETDTMVGVLSACSSLPKQNIQKWATLLEQLSNSDDYVNISLIYLHGRSGKIDKSREAFDRISENGKKMVLVWNTMINAYLQNGFSLEAISIFRSLMTNSDCLPNHVTMVGVISACAEVGDLHLGIQVHEYLRKSRHKALVSSNVNLATSLIDMYSKCGSLGEAWKVFNEMHEKDAVAFNAMLTGLATNGKGYEALRLFSEMQALNLTPNPGTFLAVLQACNHSGLIDQGREIFSKMMKGSPRLDHYACFIDLLSRSGFIEEALGIATSMPYKPNNYIWAALLAGSVLHNRLEMVEGISTSLVAVDPENSAGYVLLSNSLASDHQWQRVVNLRQGMREKGVGKQIGRSWINVGGEAREFVAGSSATVAFPGIDQVLQSLMKEIQFSSSLLHGS